MSGPHHPRAPRTYRWHATKPAILAELRELTRKRGRAVTRRDLPQSLSDAVLRELGSLDAARHAAGLTAPPRPHKWTTARVLSELRRLHRQRVRLTPRGLREAGHADVLSAIVKYVGSLARARRLAGVPHPTPEKATDREPWDEERVVADIQALHADGEPLAATRAPSKLVNAGERYFGSWRKAIEAAGLDYDAVCLHRVNVEADEYLGKLRAIAQAHPEGVDKGSLSKSLRVMLTKHFGSVDAATRKVNLRLIERIRPALTRGETLRELRRRHRRGQPVSWSKTDHARLRLGIRRHFGSWAEALEAAGLPHQGRRVWTKDTVLAALNRRKAEGASLAGGTVAIDDLSLYKAAVRHFGNYAAALAALMPRRKRR